VKHALAAIAALFILFILGSGCGGSRPTQPTEPRLLPAGSSAEGALEDFGRRLYGALARGAPGDIVLSDAALGALLLPAAAHRTLELRHTAPRLRPLGADERAMFGAASYAGLCVQQGRAEPRGGPLGLRSPGFLFERALVIGREPGGGAIASWVEGHFVNTDAGFEALSLERVEPPRRDHSDLELAVCELRVGSTSHNP
jgi:hypothetical protein